MYKLTIRGPLTGAEVAHLRKWHVWRLLGLQGGVGHATSVLVWPRPCTPDILNVNRLK